MTRFIIVLGLLSLIVGCSSSPLMQKQNDVLQCTKELKQHDAETMDAFEICRQVYRLKKLKE